MSTVTPSSCQSHKTENGCQDLLEVWQWGWDCTKFFRNRPGDTIQSVAWVVPPELTGSNDTVVGNVFYIDIANNTGTVGVPYPLIATMQTTLGATARLRINITLQDITA